jgi:hypothetical protein
VSKDRVARPAATSNGTISNDRLTSYPRHSIARDERPLSEKRAGCQSAATMMAALEQARFRAVHQEP